MKKAVLLILDVQTGLIEDNPYNRQEFLHRISQLIFEAREKGIEVIFVRHDGGKTSKLEKNTPGWEIYKDIVPIEGEKIFNKCYSSAFRGTGLHEYLKSADVGKIILAGMLTEYCVDATCKVGFELGYELFIPQGATTTYDNDFSSGRDLVRFYEEKIWNNRFAAVIPMEEVWNKT